MNAQDLKNSILQLAVQGKLVEQRPEEGTAKELLAQIKAEKEQLIKDKKIKKEKSLPEITEDEIPFEIPESWEWVRLNIFCQLEDGEKVTDVNMPYLEAAYLRGKKAAEYKSNGRLVSKGQYAILVDGENSGEVFKIDEDGILGSTFKILNICSSMYDEYVVRVLELYKNLFKNNKKGAAIPHLDKSLFSSLVIGLPPADEQKRIVAKIEEVLPYIEQYDKAYTKLEAFNKKFPEDMKKSILQMAMQGKLVEQRPEEGTADELYEQIVAEKARLIKEGKIKKEKPLAEIAEDEIPFEIPESWKWVRLRDLCQTDISYGIIKLGKEDPNGVRVLRCSDVKENYIISDFVRTVENSLSQQFSRTILEGGEIVINVRGTLGGVAVVPKEMCGYNVAREVAVIRQCNGINAQYLVYLLMSSYFQKFMFQGLRGIAYKGLNMGILAMLPVPLPPLAEQKRIVAKLEQMLPYCDQLIK